MHKFLVRLRVYLKQVQNAQKTFESCRLKQTLAAHQRIWNGLLVCLAKKLLPPAVRLLLRRLPSGREELQSINAERALEVNTKVSHAIDWDILLFLHSSVILGVQRSLIIGVHCLNRMVWMLLNFWTQPNEQTEGAQQKKWVDSHGDQFNKLQYVF